MKILVEINEIENRKTIEKSIKQKLVLLKDNKIDKPLTRLPKEKKREDTICQY